MAMTTCPECSAEISTAARACPKCGAAKPKSWLWLKLVVGVPAAILVLMMAAGFVLSKNPAIGLKTSSPELRAKRAVEVLLNDPGSAVFSNLHQGLTGQHTCGVVNAKNRMGGYVGDVPFVYRESSLGDGFAALVSRIPSRADFMLLKHLPDRYEHFKDLERWCLSIEQWNDGCALGAKITPHNLCSYASKGDYRSVLESIYKTD